MTNVFKTFFKDNKLFILISHLLVFLLACTFITLIYFFTYTASSDLVKIESTYVAFSMILLTIFIKSISTVLAVFIASRTTLGKNRLRYLSLNTNRYGYISSLLIIFIILSLSLTLLFIITLMIGSLFSTGLTNFLELMQAFISLLKGTLFMNICSLLTSFFYWQLAFQLWFSKSLKKLPRGGMISLIVGGFITFQLITSLIFGMLSFKFLFLIDINGLLRLTNIILTTSLLFVASISIFITIKEYEY